RHRADRPHHVGDHDAEHPVRGALERKAEALGERRNCFARQRLIECHAATKETARGQPPEHEVRVGDSGLLATTAVAGRPRLRAPAGPAAGPDSAVRIGTCRARATDISPPDDWLMPSAAFGAALARPSANSPR